MKIKPFALYGELGDCYSGSYPEVGNKRIAQISRQSVLLSFASFCAFLMINILLIRIIVYPDLHIDRVVEMIGIISVISASMFSLLFGIYLSEDSKNTSSYLIGFLDRVLDDRGRAKIPRSEFDSTLKPRWKNIYIEVIKYRLNAVRNIVMILISLVALLVTVLLNSIISPIYLSVITPLMLSIAFILPRSIVMDDAIADYISLFLEFKDTHHHHD